MRSRLLRRVVVLFSIVFASLLASSLLFFRATSRIVNGESWLIHTSSVLDQINSVNSSLQDGQFNARKYLETNDSRRLRAFRSAAQQSQRQAQELQNLAADTPQQTQNVLWLKRAIEDWKSEWDSSLAAPDATSRKMVSLYPPSVPIREMQQLETRLLRQRSDANTANARNIRVALLFGTVANLAFLLIAAVLIVRGENQRTQEKEAQARLAAIVSTSDDAIISKTLDGIITSWNASAERLYGYTAQEAVGKSINIIIPPDHQAEMELILNTIRQGEKIDHLETERVRRNGTRLTLEITVSPLLDDSGKIVGASAIARDVTERRQMEESLRHLSARILQAQDEERKRIARELHDTTVQKLALLSIDLAKLKSSSSPEKLDAISQHAQVLAGECVQELRTLSYVLHPPMLDELGLASALKIYAEGFSQRSGIDLDIQVAEPWERLSPEAEITLFRVAQEGLTNVMRHSGSRRAVVKLKQNGGIQLQVIDEGRGLPPDEPTNDRKSVIMGVGILGMRERLKQLGGSLQIHSSSTGTTVEARLPYGRGMDGKDSNPAG
jgi:PAS domain S-box-containing protein